MAIKTKDKLLDTAEKLFAEKGFYGTSINDIAAEVNVSKQGLLHHFPTKEQLYAAVLQKAAEHLDVLIEEITQSTDSSVSALSNIFKTMSTAQGRTLTVINLLLRELMDNKSRSEQAQQWFLKPFLNHLVELAEKAQQDGYLKERAPLAFIYMLLGATQYFLISKPTLVRLYTEAEYSQHQQQHLALLEQLIN